MVLKTYFPCGLEDNLLVLTIIYCFDSQTFMTTMCNGHSWILPNLINCYICIFLCPRSGGGGIKVNPCPSVSMSQRWFLFSIFSLPQPNVMKPNHIAYYHKTRLSLVVSLKPSKSYAPLQIEILLNFRFCSLTLVCLYQMLLKLYTMLKTTKCRSTLNFGGVTFTVLCNASL